MHIVEPELGALLDRYDNNDLAAAKKVQDLRAAMDPKSFRVQLWEIICRRPASDSLKFAAGLLEIRDIAQMLLETYLQSKEKAISVAGKLAGSDSRFDAAFLECLREDSQGWSDDALLVGLDILDAVSERDRLVLNVLRFLKHENPKLRSKAALFIARRRPQLRWVSDLSRESDARVRANTLESLFEIREDFIAPLFRQHINDENNRVAGNAILGLYRLGDTKSIQFLDQMVTDERPMFRNTGAWVMGQTGDPRFSSNLAALMSDPDKLVRRQALLGLGAIKKAFKTTRERNPLHVAVLRNQPEKELDVFDIVVATSSGEAASSINGTGFLPKIGGSFIREYTVTEYACKAPLDAAFVECLPGLEDEKPFIDQLEKAIARCGIMRRAKDNLTVSQLSYDAQLRCCASDSYAAGTILSSALNDIDFSSPNLHLIIVGAAREAHIVDKLVNFASRSTAKVHLIGVAPEWRTPELRQHIIDRGGFFRIADLSEVTQACVDFYSGLLHNYRISWSMVEGDLELEVRSNTGSGNTTYNKKTARCMSAASEVKIPECPVPVSV